MMPPRPAAFGEGGSSTRGGWRIPATILGGSLLTILPVVVQLPVMPPFGLMMMLGWRLRRQDALPPWSAVLFGLFDDLVSGQPLGSAMLLWTLCFLVIDILDTRLMWRDFRHDWLIASGAICFCLVMGRLFASPFSAHVDTMLVFQVVLSAGLFPFVMWLCARIDPRREQR